jgi:predicted SAM-dependent methyltransferase
MSETAVMSGSETAQCRSVLAPYCVGKGIDIGFGGDAITDGAWTFDMPQPYTNFGISRQMLRGDCRRLDFICDGALDYIASSHLIEDFRYAEQIDIIKEWRRCLVTAGALILNCPDQRRFVAHCARTGQSLNANHKEDDYSMRNFIDRVLFLTGDWQMVYENPDAAPYSWYLVVRKINL